MKNIKSGFKKLTIKMLLLVLISTTLFGCTDKKTTHPVYDYYFIHHQSLMKYQDQKETRSLLLSVPEQYTLDQIKLSADRKHVAFSATYLDRQILFIAEADGRNMRRILDGKKIIFDWSPQFSRLGMVQIEEDHNFFYLISSNEQDPSLIGEADDFTWSPTGNYICLHTLSYENPDQYIVHHEGSGLRFVAEGHFLGWALDGKHFFVQYAATDQTQLRTYHYDGSFINERILPIDTQIDFRSSAYEERIFFSFHSSADSIYSEWFDIGSNLWDSHDTANIRDLIRSHRPDLQWELTLVVSEDAEEIVLSTTEKVSTIIKGKKIDIISVSPDQSKMICKVTEEKGISVYYIDPTQQFWKQLSSGRQASLPQWHPDSSRVGLSMDDQMIIIETGINFTQHTYDNSAFLGWKLSL